MDQRSGKKQYKERSHVLCPECCTVSHKWPCCHHFRFHAIDQRSHIRCYGTTRYLSHYIQWNLFEITKESLNTFYKISKPLSSYFEEYICQKISTLFHGNGPTVAKANVTAGLT